MGGRGETQFIVVAESHDGLVYAGHTKKAQVGCGISLFARKDWRLNLRVVYHRALLLFGNLGFLSRELVDTIDELDSKIGS